MASRVTLSVRAMAGEQKNRLAERPRKAGSHFGEEKYQKTLQYKGHCFNPE